MDVGVGMRAANSSFTYGSGGDAIGGGGPSSSYRSLDTLNKHEDHHNVKKNLPCPLRDDLIVPPQMQMQLQWSSSSSSSDHCKNLHKYNRNGRIGSREAKAVHE